MTDGPPHLLSLKVMRLSQPALSASSHPFFSSSEPLSAHAATSIMSLETATPLEGHPQTLRDFSLSQVLTLPSTFGSIQLGETFSSILSINNEAALRILGVFIKVEMQTATNKFTLQEMGTDGRLGLDPSEIAEAVAHHEIKELGQHVLACTICYHVPPQLRNPAFAPEDPSNPTLRTLRKYYKFMVTNPLSVKTKVHTPKAPSAMLSRTEREKVFLEVHVQNLAPQPLCFEQIAFECVQGWQALDVNAFDANTPKQHLKSFDLKTVFSGSLAIMQPQDMRQYLYILSPLPPQLGASTFYIPSQPGSVIPLGRLDIRWRSSFGEPGRLLTSMLSRRVPPLPTTGVPIIKPPSHLPAHLQQAQRNSLPPQSHSQSSSISRTSTPPPFKPRVRPQSPTLAGSSIQQSLQQAFQPLQDDLELDFTVAHIPRDDIRVDLPFKVKFSLSVLGSLPTSSFRGSTQRVVHLAVQHVQRPRFVPVSHPPHTITHTEPYSPRLMGGPPSASPSQTPRRGHFNWSEMAAVLSSSPPPATSDAERRRGAGVIQLPAPFATDVEKRTTDSDAEAAIFLGSSTVFLPSLRLRPPVPPKDDTEPPPSVGIPVRAEASCQFELEYMALRKGFSVLGGLRVFVTRDAEVNGSDDGSDDDDDRTLAQSVALVDEAKLLKEWDTAGEIWVKPAGLN